MGLVNHRGEREHVPRRALVSLDPRETLIQRDDSLRLLTLVRGFVHVTVSAKMNPTMTAAPQTNNPRQRTTNHNGSVRRLKVSLIFFFP